MLPNKRLAFFSDLLHLPLCDCLQNEVASDQAPPHVEELGSEAKKRPVRAGNEVTEEQKQSLVILCSLLRANYHWLALHPGMPSDHTWVQG